MPSVPTSVVSDEFFPELNAAPEIPSPQNTPDIKNIPQVSSQEEPL